MKRLRETIVTLILCGAICILILFSPDAREGAKAGLSLCEDIIIPSLLPILIISNVIIKSNGRRLFERLFGGFFEKVLKLPRAAAGAVILGLTCGYPAGAVLTAALFSEGSISEEEAKRIMRFNLCGGAAFIITAVGTVCIGSTKTGAALFFINVIAALTVALLFALLHRKDAVTTAAVTLENNSAVLNALPDAVETTVKSLAVMSAYIVLFSAAAKIANPPAALMPILEITGGICNTEHIPPLPYLAFFLSFGGLCIHLQLIGFLKQMHIRYFDFLTGRMLCALISFALGKAYINLFPETSAVFSNLSSPQSSFTEGGAALSLVMLIGCAVIIFDIENRKLKLT